jgi:hypothetical protein
MVIDAMPPNPSTPTGPCQIKVNLANVVGTRQTSGRPTA